MHDALQQLAGRLSATLDGDRAAMATAIAEASHRRRSTTELDELDLDLAHSRAVRALESFEAGPGVPPAIVLADEDGTTVVEVHTLDGPFISSTVTEELHRVGFDPVDLAHPVLGVRRDPDGRLLALLPARQAERRETHLAFDLGRQLDAEEKAQVAKPLAAVLDDALHAITDFAALKARVAEVAAEVADRAGRRHPDEEVAEVIDLLRWLADDFFIFLGYRAYDLVDGTVRVTPGSGLGILHDESHSDYAEAVPLADLPETQRTHALEGPLLHVVRTRRPSTVHRQVRMVSIGVQKVDDEGRPAGEHRLLGLLAQKAFVEPSSTIPVLRRKLRAVLDAEDVVDHSADERALRTLFDAFPKQELFELDVTELRRQMATLLDVTRRGEVRLVARPDPAAGSLSTLVTIPRERFSAELREQVQQLLTERTGATSVDYQLSMTERDQPLLHFTLHDAPLDVDVDGLQDEIARLARTFADELADALALERGAAEGRLAARRWCEAMPPGYTETTTVPTAVADIAELEALALPDGVRMKLVAHADGADLLRFRLYKAGAGVELSGFVPLLESLGLVVVEEQPFTLADAPALGEAHIHDYGVRVQEGRVDPAVDGARIAAAAEAMWHGWVGVDSLNRLVVLASMRADEVAVLRAYRRYLRQIGTTYTEATTNDALLEHADVARALLDLFDLRFAPDVGADRAQLVDEAHAEVLRAMEAVTRLDQDRILRSFFGCIDATLRTNRWRDRPWLSLKLDSARVPGVPKPVPHREIFVYSPGMEGVHLRGGPIARGGLRWSDRLDDFRTEVLGLMKAQVSKNAVIVPTGSKGGFVLRHRPADPMALRQEVEAQYRVFIRGLLDVTDTISAGAVVGPDRVVRADGDDPYLVVAADRGTAAFSDVANAISEEYGFWLGDAFASGGSAGYDHKAMGITARGAWVAVQRHFRELGLDTQSDPITVVGVGDMSGDVFGNGMLRSRTTRLVAAFDHRDIFIDPSPDPDASFEERLRLYELARSSWQDYDRSLISEGGGVWSRTAKSVPISPQAREALRIDVDELNPPDLVKAILAAPVDLLWFGGIGTFVRARGESDADVGDRANDSIRIEAADVGARVVGEGGNLAMTQRARIAYGRRGGLCNTDAIDNVAGVNTSDREVNLKILLRAAIEEGLLEPGARDALLASMTEDVAEQVLRDSYLQTWAVSQEVHSAPGGMPGYEMLMADLESRGRLDRAVEVLPSTMEVEKRQAQGAGMTRAELCVLLAYAKIDLSGQMLDSDIVDEPAFDIAREAYFPPHITGELQDLTHRHRLRRELAATVLGNELVNRMGITWASRTAVDLGVDIATVVAAWWIARQVIDADAEWRSLEALDLRADPRLQLELKTAVDSLVDAYAHSYVRQSRADEIVGTIAEDRGAFIELRQVAMGQPPSAAWRTAAERWIDLGIDEDVAQRIAVLPALTLVPGIAATARASGRSVVDCGLVYDLVADRLPLARLVSRLMAYEPHGRWERGQHRGLVDDLRRLHHAAARRAIAEAPVTDDPADVIGGYLAARDASVRRALSLVHKVQSLAEPDLNALAVAVRALADIATA